MVWQDCVGQAAMIDSDGMFMACDLPHDACANEAGAAYNENSHNLQDKSGSL
jgi:hypothetical protein